MAAMNGMIPAGMASLSAKPMIVYAATPIPRATRTRKSSLPRRVRTCGVSMLTGQLPSLVAGAFVSVLLEGSVVESGWGVSGSVVVSGLVPASGAGVIDCASSSTRALASSSDCALTVEWTFPASNALSSLTGTSETSITDDR